MDRVTFVCPACGGKVRSSPTLAGKPAPCPHCRAHVPEWPAPEAPPPAPLPPLPPPRVFDYETEGEPGDYRPPHRRRSSGNQLIDLLTFRMMITPMLIQVMFWVGTLLFVLAGARTVAASFEEEKPAPATGFRDPGRFWGDPEATREVRATEEKVKAADERRFSPATFALGMAMLLGGPFLLRLYCELLIVIFQIHAELKRANDRRRRD